MLSSRNLSSKSQIIDLCEAIDTLVFGETGTHPWIMVDQEGGMVSRLPADCAVAPGSMALAALGDEKAVYTCAFETAKELRSLGINANFAPVLDVNTNRKNPVIGVRSFGDDPMNCSTGAKEMAPKIRTMAEYSPFFVSAHPNAGFPDAYGQYQTSSETFAEELRSVVEDGCVNILGGCCGTTPEHIRAVKVLVNGKKPHLRAEDRHMGIEGFVQGKSGQAIGHLYAFIDDLFGKAGNSFVVIVGALIFLSGLCILASMFVSQIPGKATNIAMIILMVAWVLTIIFADFVDGFGNIKKFVDFMRLAI